MKSLNELERKEFERILERKFRRNSKKKNVEKF